MDDEQPKNEIRELTSIQRRILAALMEKAFTTPDQYPLTLKSLTSACNQKSNRDPVTSHDEGAVMSELDNLREMGLIAEVFTDGGRAARYRHYMRYKFDFTETQFAIVAELLLRGTQQPGELRTRASRMKRIESQEDLRSDLKALQDKGFVTANGALDRRGVMVDHTWYPNGKGSRLPTDGPVEEPTAPSATPAPAMPTADTSDLEAEVTRLRQEVDELKLAVARLEDLMR